MTYSATVKLCYINDTEISHNKYFPEIVDKQTITIEAPAQDLNVWQHFELFKSFLRAMGFDEYNIMEAACRVAFNDGNDEAKMKKIADEYELILAEDYHKKIRQYDEQQDEEIKKLEAEIRELKAKLADILPEQYKDWKGLVPGSEEAYEQGCKCPILDNQEMPEGKKWVNGDCPLHGKSKETLEW
jgi:membrane protease subunit (stomatin/prohibitin family)